MLNKLLLPMNLQFFSEDTGTATTGAETGAAQADPVQEPAGAQTETPKTFTEQELQAEADRRVSKALETFQRDKLPSLLEKAKTEAEQLAKMSADQKAEHERKQAQADFEQRMADVTKRELRLEAHKILNEKGLPVELLDVIPYGNADECKLGIEAVEKAFRQAVENGVNARFKTSEPPKQPTGQGNSNYETKLVEARKTGNQLAASQIIREAAENGINLR